MRTSRLAFPLFVGPLSAGTLLAGVCFFSLSGASLGAATEPEQGAKAAPAANSGAEDGRAEEGGATAGGAQAEFDRQFTAWKDLLGKLRLLQENFQIADREQRPALQREFDELLKEGYALEPKLVAAGEKAFEENPQNAKLAEFLMMIAIDGLRLDDFETSYRIAKLLVDRGVNDPNIYNALGIAALCENQYGNARTYLELAAQNKTLNDKGKDFAAMLKTYEKLWPAEAKIREEEAKADDLPRVKLTTTKGEIVVELFENQAPNSTANFISLVEKGFYNDVPFHRVLQNFMAQGGDPTGSGKGGPGYSIACECYRPDARQHFRGSLSMAHAGRDTGGSQFFLTFVPTAQLNGKHTVFGRVLEGFEVLSKLQRLDPEHPGSADPDRIVKAEVLRKRDHEYVPQKVGRAGSSG